VAAVHLSSSARRHLAGACIVVALPLPIAALMASASGDLALVACLALPLAALAGGPTRWPGRRRAASLALVAPGAAALVLGGFAFLVLSIGSLCTSDQTHDYLSTAGACAGVAGFLVPYALGSAWATGRAQRVAWAWPVVIVCALLLGSITLWLLEGGVHHCET
jgi:hypothetical protein